eukprot:m.372436 g.372436  ORF g.372436 m.372436 type:complete len:64 (+) comp63109_c0_seq1:50-241(+)
MYRGDIKMLVNTSRYLVIVGTVMFGLMHTYFHPDVNCTCTADFCTTCFHPVLYFVLLCVVLVT